MGTVLLLPPFYRGRFYIKEPPLYLTNEKGSEILEKVDYDRFEISRFIPAATYQDDVESLFPPFSPTRHLATIEFYNYLSIF
jgi:hypothetical protein